VSLSTSESLSLDDTVTKTASVSLAESLSLDDTVNATRSVSVSLAESLSLDDTVTKTASVSLSESLSLQDTVDVEQAISLSLSESLSLQDKINKKIPRSFTELLKLSDSGTSLKNIQPNQILIEQQQPTITLNTSNSELVILSNDIMLHSISIERNIENTKMNYTAIKTGNTVLVSNSWTAQIDLDDGVSGSDVQVTLANSTTITGPAGWNGLLSLPTITTITIPDTSTDTFDDITAFEIGSSSDSVTFNEPVRMKFSNSGGQGFVTYFKKPGDSNVTFINTVCNSDNLASVKAQLGGTGECAIDNGTDIIVWTTHFTSFGDAHKSAKSSSSGSTGGTSIGSSGGGSRASGSGTGAAGGFGGILGTSLTINEVTYDKCGQHIARILVSSDADTAPSVRVQTAKSGSIDAKLSDNQPYAESNKITKIDKYLYEITIDSDESFLMIVVTEQKGEIKNTVQTVVRLLVCEGSIVIAKVPKDEIEETSSIAPRIFDTKFQIDDGKQYRADTESEFYYLDNQDLTVTAIIDSKISLQRAELRIIPMTQSDNEYVAVKMNIKSIPVSNSTYLVSATIPSQFIAEPAMKYWIHVLDEDQNTNESKQYSIGVKPTTIPDVLVEMDTPTIRPTGSVAKPEIYIKNENSPAFGIVSLVVDGKIVSKKSQLIETGQTKVSFDWTVPSSEGYSSNELQGRVDLYDKTIITNQALVHSYPKTITMSVYDMKPLEVLVKDDKVLADPALIYASDSDENLRFRVIDPQGQCIIGGTDECLVKESTKQSRGGLQSIPYGDQILRVKYSGSDNALERFSITSIDPITDQWTVTLETDDGFVPQVHATEDTSIKIKYRYHSETITVKSN
ncbi:hypothetical protein, partial [Nitrosarchaeum koreense]|uniref:hypothetical protein n=1 Tax=Nitrosarchaeum koreense TaxID=1088740 RepID=UPI0012FEECD2